jgi:hypothetical protein
MRIKDANNELDIYILYLNLLELRESKKNFKI